MKQQDLLIEFGTEELPPKALTRLSQNFAEQIMQTLEQEDFAPAGYEVFNSPRRIAVIIKQVHFVQPEKNIERKGPSVAAAYDADGQPTKALLGFAKSCQVELSQIETLNTPKGDWLVCNIKQKGQELSQLLPEIISHAMRKLPVPKMMRWGSGNTEFVRPIHWLNIVFGEQPVKIDCAGLISSNLTYGHRYLQTAPIAIKSAKDYASVLEAQGFVMANHEKRMSVIKEQIVNCASTINAQAIIPDNLLAEVANIVEWPTALLCQFDKDFLSVPKEALISSMQSHQKCFALSDDKGKLLPYFITVSNIKPDNPKLIITGNEKVMRARLTDAKFFFIKDQSISLEERLPALAKVAFQAQLGSMADKAGRIAELAALVAEKLGYNVQLAKHTGMLCKTDLVTDMVGEFPELQGIMGGYYARHDGEDKDVATAIQEHYQPSFAADAIPQSMLGQILAIADKIDTLVGIFGIGQSPSGSKDPFALRRLALGVLRIMTEAKLELDLLYLLQQTEQLYTNKLSVKNAAEQTFAFCTERLKYYYQSKDISFDVFEAVSTLNPTMPLDFFLRVAAINEFCSSAAAGNLIANNKRVKNILQKNANNEDQLTVKAELLQEQAEQDLYKSVNNIEQRLKPLLSKSDYKEVLSYLLNIDPPLTAFFDQVMVMTNDLAQQQNRLALLQLVQQVFMLVGDISKLQLVNVSST